jgi:tetratricopeptide (TPR) repeat protein
MLSMTFIWILIVAVFWIFSQISSAQQGTCTMQGAMPPAQRVTNCTALINSGKYNDKQVVSFLNSRGIAYSELRQFDNSIRDFDRAIATDPSFALTFNDRCYVRAIAGQLQEALPDCNVALGLIPDSAMFLDSRGFVYLKLGDVDKAIADYDAAIKLDPKQEHALYGRGLARLKKGDSAGGNADIEKAKALQKDIVEEFARYGVNESPAGEAY